MKIKILTSCSGLNFSFYEGQTAEVDTVLAKALIKAGYAEEIKETKTANTKKETRPKQGDADADA